MNTIHQSDQIENPTSATREIGRKVFRRVLWSLLLAVLCMLIATSVIFVDETEFVIVERLGNIVAVYDHHEDRGAHLKFPWPIDTVRRFDRRVRLFDPPGREIFTRDRKNITVDAYVCWKIAEPSVDPSMGISERPVVRFFRGSDDARAAQQILDARLRSILGAEFGRVDFGGLLTVSNSEQAPSSGQKSPLEKIAEKVLRKLRQKTGDEPSLRDRLGIEIIDVRIKRPNLPQGNRQAVFERMRSERRKIAGKYRSAGMAEGRVIRSRADRQYAEILARARREADEIRARAEAESISLLNRAHAQDPEFYKILQTLDTYRSILNEKTTLVLSASSNLLKLLTEGVPELEPRKPTPGSPDTESKKTETDENVSQTATAKETGPDPSGDTP